MKVEAGWPEEQQQVDVTRGLSVYDAEDLTRGRSKAVISLKGQYYTLHITKQGKLLLTK